MLALRAGIGIPLRFYLLQWLRPVMCGATWCWRCSAYGEIFTDAARLAAELMVGIAYPALPRFIAPAAFHDVRTTLGGARPSTGRETVRSTLRAR